VIFELNEQTAIELARKNQDHDLIAKLNKMRGKSKGPYYCVLYGGSDKKLALILGISPSKGAKLKQQYLSTLGLDKLLEEVGGTWHEMKHGRGSYIAVLGGYIVWCSSKHKIINYKALGSEAVVQKVAVVWVNRQIRDRGLKTKQILSVHDECLFEVPDEELDEARGVISNMYKEAAKILGLTLDWTAVAKVGKSYAAVH
jgi:DNA polymerase-1